MEKVAVIGGGQMGSQIAALSAMSGHETSIFDNNKEYLDSKLVFTRENIENLVSKDLIKKESLDNFNQNLKVYDSLETVVDDKTFVIEAVVERFDVKKEIFSTISKILDEDVVCLLYTSDAADEE